MTAQSAVCHVLVEPAACDGAWNMAVDETLLEAAINRGECWLRIYRWETPTVSLGYFQTGDDGLIPKQLSSLPAVRRLSGGGAILHDRELTYSCVIPKGHQLAETPYQLYRQVHAAILDVLESSGVSAIPRGMTRRLQDEPFLCFARQDANDIVLNGQKILGSAQRRRRGAVLQHGSLVLQHSEFTPESAGVCDLLPECALPPDLPHQLAAAISPVLATESTGNGLSIADRERAQELVEQRYQHLDPAAVLRKSPHSA